MSVSQYAYDSTRSTPDSVPSPRLFSAQKTSLTGMQIALVLLAIVAGSWILLELFRVSPFLPTPSSKIRKVHGAVAPNVAASAVVAAAVGRT